MLPDPRGALYGAEGRSALPLLQELKPRKKVVSVPPLARVLEDSELAFHPAFTADGVALSYLALCEYWVSTVFLELGVYYFIGGSQ